MKYELKKLYTNTYIVLQSSKAFLSQDKNDTAHKQTFRNKRKIQQTKNCVPTVTINHCACDFGAIKNKIFKVWGRSHQAA